jgi:hypothetical protein
LRPKYRAGGWPKSLRTLTHVTTFNRDRDLNAEQWHEVADRVAKMTRAERRVLIKAAIVHQKRLEKHIDRMMKGTPNE